MTDRPNQVPFHSALALETSGDIGSVALGRGTEWLATATFEGPKMHAGDLVPTIDALCREHQVPPDRIDAVFVSAGPGSFTGLRIGIAVARMLALSVGARLVSVPSLNVIAQNALQADPPPPHVGVILDAKRGRTFAAAFHRDSDGYQQQDEPAEVEPEAFLRSLPSGAGVIGTGVPLHREAVESSGVTILPAELYPARAEIVYRLGSKAARSGRWTEPHLLRPIYVRAPEAEEKWRMRQKASRRP